MERLYRASAASVLSVLSVLSVSFFGCAPSKVVVKDFAEGRVTDLSMTEKVTGTRDILFFSTQKTTRFLEGYIQGVVTDYDDNPVQGVVVRAVPAVETQLEEGGINSPGFAVSSFDPGVSDTNGFYRIRFSLPIVNGLVDIRGKLIYNPEWEQELSNLGRAYKPQMKESPFRLYYEAGTGMIAFVEGLRKAIVGVSTGKRKGGAAGAAPAGEQPSASDNSVEGASGSAKKKKGEGGGDDFFQGFNFGP